MKILLFSNAPTTPSGYGVQANLMYRGLTDLGHEVYFANNFGVQGTAMPYKKSLILPAGQMTQARDEWIPNIVRTIEPDVVISLYDLWSLTPQVWQNLEVPWYAWPVLDSSPIDAQTHNLLMRAQKPGDRVIACSKWARDEFRAAGFEADYIPLMVDFELFNEATNYEPDTFNVMMIGRNNTVPVRKGFYEALYAFKDFSRTSPRSKLYLITTMDKSERGMDILAEARRLDLEDRVVYPDQDAMKLGLIDRKTLSQLMADGTVLLQPSSFEGFGLPILESKAMGIPPITHRHSAMEELAEVGGRFIKHQGRYGVRHSVEAQALIPEITIGLREMYREWKLEPHMWNSRRQACIRDASLYNYKEVCAMWSMYLKENL